MSQYTGSHKNSLNSLGETVLQDLSLFLYSMHSVMADMVWSLFRRRNLSSYMLLIDKSGPVIGSNPVIYLPPQVQDQDSYW